jgi:hypothetical protein
MKSSSNKRHETHKNLKRTRCHVRNTIAHPTYLPSKPDGMVEDPPALVPLADEEVDGNVAAGAAIDDSPPDGFAQSGSPNEVMVL